VGFPAIVDAALRIQASSFLIDGETVIARDDGTPDFHALRSQRRGQDAVLFAFRLGLEGIVSKPRKDASAGSDFSGGDAHRVLTAAQNCSVTAVVSSVTFQPSLSAFSLANLSSI
jgi:hypothetical protein